MSKKNFTLVELIITIIVIGILVAIVSLQVGEWRKEAIKAAVSANVKNIQTASDHYKLDGKGTIGNGVSTIENPKEVDFSKTIPSYIRKKPEVGKYWIDSNDVIWGSTINPPSVSQDGNTYSWPTDKDAEAYHIYEIEKKKRIEVPNSPITDNEFEGEPGKEYLFSAEDKLELETVPVGTGYVVANNPETQICTLKTEEGIYTATQNFTGKYVERNVYYNKTIVDNEGMYVAVGSINEELAFPYSGVAIDKYNKDMRLIDTLVIPDTNEDTLFGLVDVIQNSDGDYVSLSSSSSGLELIKFNSDLEIVDRQNVRPPATSTVSFHSVIQDENGNYFISGVLDQEIGVVKVDSSFNMVGHKKFEDVESNNIQTIIYDFILLDNGDLLVSGYENEDIEDKGRLIRLDDNLNKLNEYVLSGYGINMINKVAQDSVGNIVAFAGREAMMTSNPMLIKLAPDLTLLNKIDIDDNNGDAYVGPNLIEKDGTYSILKSHYGSKSYMIYDSNFNNISEIDVSYFPSIYGTITRDNGSYLVTLTDGVSPKGIYKYKTLETGNDNFVYESAPRAIHTHPPLKYNLKDLNSNQRYSDESNMSGSPDNGPPSEPSPFPEPTGEYQANYNAANDSIDPVYAGSIIFEGAFNGMNEPFFVEPDGTYRPLTQEDPNGAVFQLVKETDSLLYYPLGDSLPLGAIPKGPTEENPTEPDGVKVDPCYAGSFMIKISDMNIYKVKNDGSLELIGNPYQMSPEEIGYNIWKDSLFYLYPNGVIVNFPEIYYEETHM